MGKLSESVKVLQEADGPFLGVVRGEFNKGSIFKGKGRAWCNNRGDDRQEGTSVPLGDGQNDAQGPHSNP